MRYLDGLFVAIGYILYRRTRPMSTPINWWLPPEKDDGKHYYEVELGPEAFRALVRLVDKGTRPGKYTFRDIVNALKDARQMEGKPGELRTLAPDWDRLEQEMVTRGGLENFVFDVQGRDE